LNLVFAPVVFPLQRLQVVQVITAALGDGYDMINLPAVSASGVAKVLADDGPTPGIHPQSGMCSQAAGLLPNGLDDFGGEGSSAGVSVRFSFHDMPHATALSLPTAAGPDPNLEGRAPAPNLHRSSTTCAGTVLDQRLKGPITPA